MSSLKNKPLLRRRFLSVIPAAVVLLYCLWYWSHDHAELVGFYLDLNPVFYKSGTWSQQFFTEGTKSLGNWWCAAALLAAVFLSRNLSGRLSGSLPQLPLRTLPLMLLLLAGAALAIKAWTQSRPASDEVFSALALAGLPSFQTLSYYPLPNNHVFFNLLNGFFAFATEDLVFSGRLLSTLSYLAVLLLSFFFFVKMSGRQWHSLFFTLLVAVQFPIWGWSGQARGYEMMLLFGVVSLLAGWQYLRNGAAGLPAFYVLAVAMGLLTQPAFLFWWVGLFTGGCMIAFGKKALLRQWILANACAGALALILYLPLLTFSGAQAIVANPYVQPSAGDTASFLSQQAEQHYLGGLFHEWLPLSGTTWLAPLPGISAMVLLLRSGNRQRQLALLALGIFGSALLMVVLMRKAPFHRVFIAHSWLYWMVVLSAVLPLLKTPWRYFTAAIITVYLLFAARANRRLIPHNLYYYDVNAHFETLKACQPTGQQGQSVGLSDESFFWQAILKNPVDYGTTGINGQGLLIVHSAEQFRPDERNYVLWKDCGEFLIFRRSN